MEKKRLEYNEIRYRMALPYEIKLAMSRNRVREYINYYGEDKVVLCFSGGLDSTVALHFIRNYCGYKNVKAVSVIGIECKQNIELIMKTENIEIAKVRYSQQEIIEKFGTPIISKQTSKMIAALQNPSEKNAKMRGLALTGITSTGREAKTFKLAEKWKFLIDCPVSISNKCCYYMKETPVQNLAKEKGYAVIVATMAEESKNRMDAYAKQGGCNVFNELGYSTPFAFWVHQDILRYAVENNVEISAAYGEIVQDENGEYRTTKAQRTGCPVCLFGMQFDKTPNRLQRMYYEDNRTWQRVICDFGYKKILDFMISNGHTEFGYYPDEVETADRAMQYDIQKSVAEKKKRNIEREIAAIKQGKADPEKLESLLKDAKKYKKEVRKIKKNLEVMNG